MNQLIFFLFTAFVVFIGYRGLNGKTIIPSFKKKKKSSNSQQHKQNNINKKGPKWHIKDLLLMQDIKLNMIHYPNNTYVMALRAEHVNYHLLNSFEQEGIDMRFESWLASMNYDYVIWHMQSRYLDLHQQINTYEQNIRTDSEMNEEQLQYGENVVDYIKQWWTSTPRYEVVRYVLFPFRLKHPGEDEYENHQRALFELSRRALAAQKYLSSCGVESQICKTVDLAEMIYCALNRKRATKARFKDVNLHEMLALYCTAEQKDSKALEILKEMEQMNLDVEIEEADGSEDVENIEATEQESLEHDMHSEENDQKESAHVGV